MKSFLKKITGGRNSALSNVTKSEAIIVKDQDIKKALSNIIDPDFKKDIVTLGFVRNLKLEAIEAGTNVSFDINLTTPACPVKEKFRQDAIAQVKNIPANDWKYPDPASKLKSV